jgi:hypothetical protein
MRNMALDAALSPVMKPAVDRRNHGPAICWILQKGMAPQAQLPVRVSGQELEVIRVTHARAVTVLAFNLFVWRASHRPDLLPMAFSTGIPALVLGGKFLPLLNVAQAVIVIGKGFAVNAEVVWHQKRPGNQQRAYQSKCHPQRVQDVPFHKSLP